MIKQEYGVNSKVVYPGIDTELFRPSCNDKEDYVLTVGALTTRKGHAFLVRAISHIDACRRPSLFIAANSSEEAVEAQLRALAERLGVALHIERITDDRRLVEVYSCAKAFVYAPRYEALGMAPLEALACGTPVVAVKEGGVKETLNSGSGALLLERDPAAFASKLEMLLTNDRTREDLGRIGRQYVETNWRWECAVDRLESYLENSVAD
jgi:glycosyltransferase involved in cell wall biosynthesis